MQNDSRMGLHLVVGLVAAAVLSTSVSPVLAQGKGTTTKRRGGKQSPEDEKRDAAREAYGAGEEKFKAGDFGGAAESYKLAYEILPSAQAQLKYATALDKAGRGSDAAAAYKKFLDIAPADKMEEQKKTATERVAALAEGVITVLSEPGNATVKIDGVAVEGKTPMTTKAKPGKHVVEVSLLGHDAATKDVAVTASGVAKIEVTLRPTAAPTPPPVAAVAVVPEPSPPPALEKPPEPPPSKTPAYVTLGLAGAGAIVGAVFGFAALSSKSDFDKSPTTKTADSAERNALISDMAFGAAVTLGVTGTVLYLNATKKQDPAKTGAFRLSPLVSPKVQGAAATFRF